MTYAGWNPAYRTFQQSSFKAVGGETTIPNKGAPESVLYKNGQLLVPGVGNHYTLDVTTGNFTLATPAAANDLFQVINFSTFHLTDSYTRKEINDTFLLTHITVTTATPVTLGTYQTAVAIDTSGGPTYVTLPANPKIGINYRFYDYKQAINTINKFTVKRNGGTGTIMGIAEDMDVTIPRVSFTMTYDGVSDWRVF